MGVGQAFFLPYILKYNFKTILDIGCGVDTYMREFFLKHGKQVYGIDILDVLDKETFHFIQGDFRTHKFQRRFDAVLASHMLEHDQDTGCFLNKVYDVLVDEGVFFCIVPPHKTNIVGGHVTIGWNIGILMYNLILCGFNVREGRFRKHGYNIAAFVRKRKDRGLPDLFHDNGDIEKLRDYFPDDKYFKHGFDGDMLEWNWFKELGEI